MAFAYEWSERYATGIDIVDMQHQRLFQYLRDIDQALKERQDQEVEIVAINLIEYSISHCIFEETLMEQAGYPLLEPHRQGHDKFRQRVEQLMRRIRRGEDPRQVARDLRACIALWLNSHIAGDDQDYVPYVKRMLAPDGNRLQRLLDRLLGRSAELAQDSSG